MTESEKTIPCPFCAEPIQPRARKCKHCGEWLDEPAKTTKGGTMGRGSADARAVAKGIKQQKLQESLFNFFVGAAIVIGIIVGLLTWSWQWGTVIAIGLAILASFWYHRE